MTLKTPLYDTHIQLNARMIDFGGWLMPVQYTTVMEEHLATRTKAGLFDICHMGELIVYGNDAKSFLQKMITNDLNQLQNNTCFYTALCNEHGGTIDDLFVYQFSTESYMLVVNASTIEKDFTHLMAYSDGYEVTIEDRSEEFAKLDLQGPLSEKILQKITPVPLNTLKRFHFIETTLLNKEAIISRTGYTGENGFELYLHTADVVKIWNELLKVGQSEGLQPIGLGARDTLRIEACYSLYGHELSDTITPIEAGIGFIVKEKPDAFIGKSILQSQKHHGAPRHLICFEMTDKSIPRDHYPIYKDGQEIGMVSSGTFSPTFKKGLGLGFVTRALTPGDSIDIKIRDALRPAIITQRPFYKIL